MKHLLKNAEKTKDGNITTVELPEIGSWPPTHHAVEHNDILAMIAALGSERALLLTGEPGVGKSHLARVAAKLTNRFFISTVIKPDDEIGDLLWSIDHTQRLADAQLAGASKQKFDKPLKDYLRAGPVWFAFENTENQHGGHYQAPQQEADYTNGVVLLIDEIDKASVALLNSLLEVLGNMSFEVPLLGDTIGCREKPPLIIMTSNGDRALPSPLLRRCVSHEVSLPKQKEAFHERMKLIAKAKMQKNYDEAIAEECAKLIYTQRNRQGVYAPGASEFVDMLNALHAIAPDDKAAQLDIHLPEIGRYFLK